MELLVAKRPAGPSADEWTSFSDVGERFRGERLTLHEYARVEGLHVTFVERLFDSLGGGPVRVREPRLGMPPPAWLGEFRNGTRMDRGTVTAVLRSMLRGLPMGCVLALPELSCAVRVGFDYCLFVEVPDDLVPTVQACLPDGLSVLREQPHVEEEEYVTALADDAFWAALKDGTREENRPLWILESWAYDDWGERWYLAGPAAIDDVRGRVYPNSVIRAAFDLEVEVVELSEYFDDTTAASTELLDVRAFPYPPEGWDLGARPLAGYRPLRGRAGLFRPEQFYRRGTGLFEAVAPDVDGRLTARWLT